MANIMIVDDEPDVRLVVRMVLEKAGHEVVEANGAEECIERLSKAPVDLVFVDIRMPGMDGWQMVKAIKKYQENIPVAMLTVEPLTQETLEGKEIKDLADYITKPFSSEDIVEVVKQISD
ncbi:response regulator [archaeon]|nr:response regulator [archaeon]